PPAHPRLTTGVMVSTSHNPYQDNGIKVLSGSGTKLSESVELEIERALDLDEAGGPDEQARPLETESAIEPDPALMRDYVDHLVSLIPDGNHGSRASLVFD